MRALAHMTSLFGIGFLAAFLSSLTGAGASLFATPLLLSLDIPVTTVLACNQLCAALWTPIASGNYRRGERLDAPLVCLVATAGIVGVWSGYLIAIRMPAEQMKPLIGAIILAVVSVVWCRPRGSAACDARKDARWLAIVAGFPLGAYQAFFGGGNTLFSSLMFMRTQGFDFRRALAHSYAVAFVWCALSALLFWLGGWVQWGIAVPTAAGSLVGAFLGSRFGSVLSNNSLRRLFLVSGAGMGCKLLLDF